MNLSQSLTFFSRSLRNWYAHLLFFPHLQRPATNVSWQSDTGMGTGKGLLRSSCPFIIINICNVNRCAIWVNEQLSSAALCPPVLSTIALSVLIVSCLRWDIQLLPESAFCDHVLLIDTDKTSVLWERQTTRCCCRLQSPALSILR